jgi:RNA polymerase sigma-70 factor (ECF subfamily)
MKTLLKRFKLFIQSSFSNQERNQLFELIWKKYKKHIYFYISGVLQLSPEQADDVFQEVMIKIYTNLHRFNPIYSIKPLLYTITKNCCLNYIKNKTNQKEILMNPETSPCTEIPGGNSPEESFFQDTLLEEIDRFVNDLKLIDREIFYLRFFEGLKFKAVSKITGLNVNTIKSKIHTLKIKLKKQLRRAK